MPINLTLVCYDNLYTLKYENYQIIFFLLLNYGNCQMTVSSEILTGKKKKILFVGNWGGKPPPPPPWFRHWTTVWVPWNYTQRQKKLITSSERHSLTKIHPVKLNHIYLYTDKHLKKIKACLCQKGEKCGEIAKGRSFFPGRKSRANSTERAFSVRSIALHSISIAGCTVPVYSPGGEQFLWFLKNYLLQFHRIFSIFTQANIWFFFFFFRYA